MTQEEKSLLLQDLCARLPYDVAIYCESNHTPQRIVDIDFDKSCIIVKPYNKKLIGVGCVGLEDIKPYLRPISSMTEEEKKIMRSCGFEPILYDTGYTGFANIESCIDEVSFRFMEEFLNSHHFDYRGLIEKGLAIEAPEGMYES